MIRIISSLLFLLCLSLLSAGGADRDVLFLEGNRAFESGKFEEAVQNYGQLINAGESSPDLYYNLATAHFRAGSTGQAVLWLRRAALLDPTLPEVRQNLAFLRTQFAFLEFADSDWLQFLSDLPSSLFPWLVSLLFWIGLILAIIGFCLPAFRQFRSWGITLGIICLMLAFVVHRISDYRQSRIAPENFATVVADKVEAVTSPTPTAKPVIELPPGSELRVLQVDKNWVYADIPGELRGWVRTNQIAQNWPVFQKTTADSQ